MSYNLPKIPLTPDERMWLARVSKSFRDGFLLDADYLKRYLLQKGKWPEGLRPSEIDDRLLTVEYLSSPPGTWHRPTLLGIWHVDPATDLLDKCDRMVQYVKRTVSASSPIKIKIEDISANTGISPLAISLIIRLLPGIGLPTSTTSGGGPPQHSRGVPTPGQLGVFTTLNFDDPEVIDSYLIASCT